LRELDVSGNPIGDDGMTLISSELQYNNVLTELGMQLCGLSVKGILLCIMTWLDDQYTFCTGVICINKLCSLQVLNISYNDIGDDIGAIVSKNQLNELKAIDCGITPTGARSLAAGLLCNNSIRKLCISKNQIGDDGITAIAETFYNSCIETLNVSDCGITHTGAISLSAGLVVNGSIKNLNVSQNHIGDDGIVLLTLYD